MYSYTFTYPSTLKRLVKNVKKYIEMIIADTNDSINIGMLNINPLSELKCMCFHEGDIKHPTLLQMLT